jgi:hypothetical protein
MLVSHAQHKVSDKTRGTRPHEVGDEIRRRESGCAHGTGKVTWAFTFFWQRRFPEMIESFKQLDCNNSIDNGSNFC